MNTSNEDARRAVVSETAGSRGPAWPVRGEIEDVLLRVLEGQPELRQALIRAVEVYRSGRE